MKVDIRNLARNRFYITKESHIPPSDYEKWPYYEYEFLIEDLNEYIKEENKRQEDAEKNNGSNTNSMMADMRRQTSNMMKSARSSMPKAPKR